jgi:hypothetical protein
MWVDPIDTLSKVFVQALRYSSTATETVGMGQISIPDDINPFVDKPTFTIKYFFRYPVFFLWRTTPVILLGILMFILFSLKKSLVQKNWSQKLVGFWILIVIYTVGITLPWKTSEKYYAPVFLLSCLIAGIGWVLLSDYLSHKTGKTRYGIGLLSLILIVQLFTSLNHFPYYFTYFNPFLGGAGRASQTRTIGVGEGLDIAGRYLDSKPDSEGFRVMSYYGIGPFSYFFDGQVEAVYGDAEGSWTPEYVSKLQHMDFLVIYTNQKFRNGPARLFELLEEVSPIYTVELHGVDYAWIYKTGDISLDNEVWD